MNTTDYYRVEDALKKAKINKGLRCHTKVLREMLSSVKGGRSLDITEKAWLNVLFE
mgnify:CR=1 FL=1